MNMDFPRGKTEIKSHKRRKGKISHSLATKKSKTKWDRTTSRTKIDTNSTEKLVKLNSSAVWADQLSYKVKL